MSRAYTLQHDDSRADGRGIPSLTSTNTGTGSFGSVTTSFLGSRGLFGWIFFNISLPAVHTAREKHYSACYINRIFFFLSVTATHCVDSLQKAVTLGLTFNLTAYKERNKHTHTRIGRESVVELYTASDDERAPLLLTQHSRQVTGRITHDEQRRRRQIHQVTFMPPDILRKALRRLRLQPKGKKQLLLQEAGVKRLYAV